MPGSVWNEFGFSETPYRKTPLDPTPEDEQLFTPREEESAKFLTLMDCKDGCVVVVSGDTGIGKTSFVNIQQHLLETEQAGLGPKLVACRKRTPLLPDCDANALARRVVEHALLDLETFCSLSGKKVPQEATRVRDWISSRESTNGYQIGIIGFSFGRNMWVPPVKDASFETWCTVLESIAVEARRELEVDGITVCLENAETIPIDDVTRLLMTLRDTLFVSKAVWWILIGQSDLYGQIQSRDTRVSQRLRGRGVELGPLDAAGFHDVIERRVKFYRKKDEALSPLSEAIHARLFEAGRGEVRFALDAAETLMTTIVTKIRSDASRSLRGNVVNPRFLKETLQKALRAILIEERIPDGLANSVLSDLATEWLGQEQLDGETIARLVRIGEGKVQAKEYAQLDFISENKCAEEFLDPMWKRGVLSREGLRGSEVYRLKGFAKIAYDCGRLRGQTEKSGSTPAAPPAAGSAP